MDQRRTAERSETGDSGEDRNLALFPIERALYDPNSTGETLQSPSDDHAKNLVGLLSKASQDLVEALCFLDVVLILPTGSGGRSRSRGYVAAFHDQACKEYQECVTTLLRNKHGVAGHPAFLAGLPTFHLDSDSQISPRTEQDLKDILRNNNIEAVQETYLSRRFNDNTDSPASNPMIVAQNPRIKTIPWNIDNEQKQYGDESRSIDDNFDKFCKSVEDSRNSFIDKKGGPILCFSAIPVCWWIRGTDNRFGYKSGGSCLIGSSRPLSPSEVTMIRMAVANAVGTGFVVRAAEMEGRETGLSNAMKGFGHQIKKIADMTGEGWQVSPASWDIIQRELGSNPSLGLPHRIVPVPDIYRDLGKTLTLWSLSYAPDDLYKPSGHIPADLGALVQVAWEYAKANLFVKFCAGKDFESDARHVADAINYKKTLTHRIDSSLLSPWRIQSACFADDSNRCKLTDDTRNRQAHCELSGLLRVFVVACENFVRHGKTESMTVTTSYDPGTAVLSITCRNAKGDGKQDVARDHMGMTGSQLIKYICEEFLRTLNAKVSSADDNENPYWLTISLEQPKWLIRSGG